VRGASLSAFCGIVAVPYENSNLLDYQLRDIYQPVADLHVWMNQVFYSCSFKELAEGSHCSDVVACLAVMHGLGIEGAKGSGYKVGVSLEAQLHGFTHLSCLQNMWTSPQRISLCPI
jgi:hypothetical protein